MNQIFARHLANIEKGVRVRSRSILNSAPEAIDGRSLLDIFVIEGSYICGIADHDSFAKLIEHYGRLFDGQSRVTASVTGNSHRVAVAGGLLVIRSKAANHPEVVLFDDFGNIALPRNLSPNLLIVENLENFLQFDRTVQFCVDCCAFDAHISQTEVLFGAGNLVSGALFSDFLSSFSRVGVLPDPDLGGLRTCRSLERSIGHRTNLEILVPSNLDERLKQGIVLTESERNELLKFADGDSASSGVARLLLKAGKKLEQETYLYTGAVDT